jgi:hypothetical protein
MPPMNEKALQALASDFAARLRADAPGWNDRKEHDPGVALRGHDCGDHTTPSLGDLVRSERELLGEEGEHVDAERLSHPIARTGENSSHEWRIDEGALIGFAATLPANAIGLAKLERKNGTWHLVDDFRALRASAR